jgi:2-desacetyl-2-hydroxyethyl bacteriochlorophyllide A dehydrogenase
MESYNIIFAAPNVVEVRCEPIPEMGLGQILVRSTASLISTGTESICLGRKFAPGTHWDNWVKYPFPPGYLCAGQVIAIGGGVTQFQVGDRVTTRAYHRQFNICSASDVLPIPDGVSEAEACWYALAKTTQTAVRRAKHTMGDAVVLVGLGLLGQLVTQYLRLSGAREIIVIDTAPLRLEMAKAHGATQTLQMSVADAKEKVLTLTDGHGADVVYDITGHYSVLPHALGLARRLGKVLLLGDTGTPSEQRLTSDVVTRGVSIVGAHDSYPPPMPTESNRWTNNNMGLLFLNYLARGQMSVNDLVTHRFSPHDAPGAYQLLETDRSHVMGVMFDWSQLS